MTDFLAFTVRAGIFILTVMAPVAARHDEGER